MGLGVSGYGVRHAFQGMGVGMHFGVRGLKIGVEGVGFRVQGSRLMPDLGVRMLHHPRHHLDHLCVGKKGCVICSILTGSISLGPIILLSDLSGLCRYHISEGPRRTCHSGTCGVSRTLAFIFRTKNSDSHFSAIFWRSRLGFRILNPGLGLRVCGMGLKSFCGGVDFLESFN